MHVQNLCFTGKHTNATGRHDIQHNKVNVPSTSQTAHNIQYFSAKTLISPSPVPLPTIKQVVDSTYKYSPYSQCGTLQSLPSVPKNLPYQYSSEQFFNQLPSPRIYTPTVLNDNTSPSTSQSSGKHQCI